MLTQITSELFAGFYPGWYLIDENGAALQDFISKEHAMKFFEAEVGVPCRLMYLGELMNPFKEST